MFGFTRSGGLSRGGLPLYDRASTASAADKLRLTVTDGAPWSFGPTVWRYTNTSRPLLLGEPADRLSRALFVEGYNAPGWAELRRVYERAVQIFGPLALTSVWRPTGSHQYGAIDVAPVVFGEAAARFASNPQVKRPLLMYARLPVVLGALVLSDEFPELRIGVEDNHLHLQWDPVVPRQVLATLPPFRVLLKPEWKAYAGPGDADFSGEEGLKGVTPSLLGLDIAQCRSMIAALGALAPSGGGASGDPPSREDRSTPSGGATAIKADRASSRLPQLVKAGGTATHQPLGVISAGPALSGRRTHGASIGDIDSHTQSRHQERLNQPRYDAARRALAGLIRAHRPFETRF